MSAVEKFPVLLSEAEEESSAVPPCFSDEGINVRAYFEPVALIVMLRLWGLIAIPVSLHSPFEPLPPRPYQAQHQCRRNPTIPT